MTPLNFGTWFWYSYKSNGIHYKDFHCGEKSENSRVDCHWDADILRYYIPGEGNYEKNSQIS